MFLESSGRAANEEASALREELEKAREALASRNLHVEDLSKRLRNSEEECRQARRAQVLE